MVDTLSMLGLPPADTAIRGASQQPQGMGGFLQGDAFGNMLTAAGISLMSSPRNAPLSNFGQALNNAQTATFRQQQADQEAAAREEEKQRRAELAQYALNIVHPSLRSLAQSQPEVALKLNEQMQPKAQGLINAGDGRLYDPNSGQWIVAPDSAAGMTDTQQNLMWRAQQAGLQPNTPEWQQFMMSGGAGGTSLSVGPDGSVSFQQGGGMKPLTEGQSKDTVYATRANAALPQLEAYEQSLLSLGESVAGNVPVLGNFMQSEEYQLGRDAGLDFLIAVLRKDTGAAVTPSEEQFYGRIFLPQPGDKPSVVEAKRQRRAMAVAAIEAGMPAQALENMARALATDGAGAGDALPPPAPAQSGTNAGTTSSGLTWTVR